LLLLPRLCCVFVLVVAFVVIVVIDVDLSRIVLLIVRWWELSATFGKEDGKDPNHYGIEGM